MTCKLTRMLLSLSAMVASGMCLAVAAMAFQASNNETANKQAVRDIRRLIPATLNARLGPSDNPEIVAEVQRDEEFAQKAVGIRFGNLQGVAVQRWADGDALVAKWLLPGDSPYLAAWIRDTAASNYLMFQVPRGTFSSPEAIRSSLNDMAKRGQVKIKHLGVTIDPKGAGEQGALATGFAELEHGPSTQLPDWTYVVYAFRHGGDDFIVLEIGKSVVPDIYPQDMLLVPDRFPSIKARAREWSTEQIMREVGKSRNRDDALADILSRRPLSQPDFDQIFAIGAAAPPRAQVATKRLKSFRASVMRQIADASGGAQYREEFLRTLQQLSHEPAREADLASFILALRRMKVDLSSEIVEVAEQGMAVKEGIAYLADRGRTQETLDRLRKLQVAPELEREKKRALDRIDSRKHQH